MQIAMYGPDRFQTIAVLKKLSCVYSKRTFIYQFSKLRILFWAKNA